MSHDSKAHPQSPYPSLGSRTRSRVLLFALRLTSIALFPWQSLHAQNDYLERIGRPEFAVTQPIEMGFVNLANGNMHLEIPLATVAQRRGGQLTAKLVYDSKIYEFGGLFWYVSGDVVVPSDAGWRFAVTGNVGFVDHGNQDEACNLDPWNVGYITYFSPFTLEMADGSTKRFSVTTSIDAEVGECSGHDQPNASGYADDGSGYFIEVTGYTAATVYDNEGNQIYPRRQDANGNYFSEDSNGNIIDELGRTQVIKTVNGNLVYYDILNSQGSRSRFTVTKTNLNVHTAFGVPNSVEYSGTLTAIQSWPDPLQLYQLI